MEISGPDTKAERILELGHTILGEIGSTAAAGISSPGLRIRVRLSSEQFEAEEGGRPDGPGPGSGSLCPLSLSLGDCTGLLLGS